VTHRRLDAADIYLVANTGPRTERVEVRLRNERNVVERWDAHSGEVLARGPGARPVALTLQAYEAAVLVASDDTEPAPEEPVPGPSRQVLALDGSWTLRLPLDAPETPVSLPHRWEDTASLRSFAGTGVYTTTVQLDHAPAAAELDLGDAVPRSAGSAEEAGLRGRSFRAAVVPPVGEVAEVVVNGAPVGVVWGTPYRLQIGRHLRAGANTLEVRVSNTAAAALAADPAVLARADESARLFGRRFRMQDLDLATAGLSSGLLTVPRLLLSPS
jgi:hypothetical protein